MSTKVTPYLTVLNRLWSKAQPDGIYISPETGEKYNLNDPYDREEIVTAETWREMFNLKK